MKLYVAGKISGLDEDEAFRLFEEAERLLIAAGHTPLNPMKLVDQAEGREYEEYLLDALRVMILDCEGVYFLSNWQDSFGARIEHAIAVEMKTPRFYAASELPVGCDWPELMKKAA